jgi:hypothetical protein
MSGRRSIFTRARNGLTTEARSSRRKIDDFSGSRVKRSYSPLTAGIFQFSLLLSSRAERGTCSCSRRNTACLWESFAGRPEQIPRPKRPRDDKTYPPCGIPSYGFLSDAVLGLRAFGPASSLPSVPPWCAFFFACRIPSSRAAIRASTPSFVGW